MKELAFLGLAVFVVACLNPTTPKPTEAAAPTVTTKKKRTPNPTTSGGGGGTPTGGGSEYTAPSNTELGIVGWLHYGTDYETLRNEISTGNATFWFYGKSNGQGYPTGQKNGNGYETVCLTTHSITSLSGKMGVVSKCRYKIKDNLGNLIVLVDDTKGGFHPAHYGDNKRGNNHPDDANRYLPNGTYTLEYDNISDDSGTVPQKVVFFRQHEGNTFEYQINETVNKGESTTRTFTISDTGAEANVIYKLNNNFE